MPRVFSYVEILLATLFVASTNSPTSRDEDDLGHASATEDGSTSEMGT